MFKIEKTEFSGWKNCYRVTNGKTVMVVLCDVGPRIVYFGTDKVNHLKLFDDTLGVSSKAENFVAYGGHRVWHAPEMEVRTYFSDNYAVDAYVDGNTLYAIAPIEKETNLQRGFIISKGEGECISVKNVIINKGWYPIEVSSWGISQFAHGGLMAVPNSRVDTGLVGNRVISMWPYSAMNDNRVTWGDRYVFVQPDTAHAKPFKFGSTNDDGFAAYFNFGQMVVKKFPFTIGGNYPNYHCNFESYTNSDFIEIESLTPLTVLARGEEVVLEEAWYIFDNVDKPERGDENAVTAALKAAKIL